MLRRLAFATTASAILGLALVASASITTGYDLPTLVARSEHAISAHVLSTSCRYDAERRIVTDVQVRVDEVGKGRARRGETLHVVVLGGSLDGVTMRIEGGAHLAPGEDAMLFLERRPRGELMPLGLSQGVMPIVEQGGARVVVPGAAGLSLVRRDRSGRAVRAEPALTAPEELSSFLARVRTLAGSAP